MRMLREPGVHLFQESLGISVRLSCQPFLHRLKLLENRFSLHIRSIPLVATARKPPAAPTRAVPPPGAAAPGSWRWLSVSGSTSEDNPADKPRPLPNAPRPPWLLLARGPPPAARPPAHPPPACAAAP